MSSMNSLTSRPRSPIRPTTITSAPCNGHHAEQDTLAHARAGKQANPLASAEVNRALMAAPRCPEAHAQASDPWR